MKRLHYIIFFILSAAVLSWVLPWIFSLCFTERNREPFVAYSPLTDSFVVTEFAADGKGEATDIYTIDPLTHTPLNHFTMDQRDSLLPEIFVGQLSAKGQLPDSIKGVEINMREIRMNSWIFTSSPKDFNRAVPRVFPLMESMPARFKFEDPSVVMTLNDDGLQITDIETNRNDAQKTARFAKMFADKGFAFPAIEAAANITSRKGYDNGYLIIDADRKLYHLKMQAGRPSMARIELPDSIVPTHAYVFENADRQLYGLLSAKDGNMYAVNHDDTYSISKLSGISFDPTSEKMTIMKNLFSWCVKINSDDRTEWVALDPTTLSVMATYTYSYVSSLNRTVRQWIFPFVTTFTSTADRFVYPRIGDVSPRALVLNALLALIVIFAAKGPDRRCTAGKFVVTLLLGLFAFIPLMLIKQVK